MFASIAAANTDIRSYVYEKNEKLGKKILYYWKRKMQYYQCLQIWKNCLMQL